MNIRRANILTLNVFFCYVPVCRVALLQQLFSCLQNNLVFYYLIGFLFLSSFYTEYHVRHIHSTIMFDNGVYITHSIAKSDILRCNIRVSYDGI